MIRRSRALMLGGTAAVALTAAVVLPTGTEAAVSPVKPHVMQQLNDVDQPAAEPSVDINTQCGSAAANPVPDGQPIVVTIGLGPSFTVGLIPSTWWKKPPYTDPGWELQVRGFMWLQPLAQRAYQDGQAQSLDTLVQQLLLFHKQNPDPGTTTATSTANANAWGWDEGTALRRLGAENCLYSVTKDARLVPGMQADVSVQYGTRFYGPPYHAVHNHGVMADLAIIRAGDLLARKDWQDRSITRLESEAPTAFTPSGTTYEQSSSYHVFNAELWGEVASVISTHRSSTDANAAKVRAIDARANQVTAWLTEPDVRLTVFGDANADPGATRSKWTSRIFRDNTAGVAVGRWSWTDPATSYYCIRYGPRRWAHGQQDRSGVTWSTGGLRVLVNPGKAVYDAVGNNLAWVQGATSHNVAVADKRVFNTNGSVSMTGASSAATWQAWITQDSLYGIKHTRWYTVVNTRTLVVKDAYDQRAAFHQIWHLDPKWVLAARSSDGKRLTFTAATHTLTVASSAAGVVYRGVSRPVRGWNFPNVTTRISAAQIEFAAPASATTTFKVT